MLFALSGCEFAAAGYGSGDNVAWAFTINNGAPTTSGGLIVIVTSGNGTVTTYNVPPGGSLSIPADGSSVSIRSGSSAQTVTPGQTWFWTGSTWSTNPLAPSASG